MAEVESPQAQIAARVPAAREFFAQLRKGSRTIAMYRHNSARFAEFLQPALAALATALQPGPLTVKVSSEAFLVGTDEVWTTESGENVPFRFYREGIRQLVLRPGVTEAELGSLVGAMLTASERTGEEIVGKLWSAGFEHVEYVIVEGFKVGELSEEQVQVEVDSIVDYLASRLRGSGDDSINFARIRAADLDLKLEGIEQVRGAIFEGDAVAKSFQQKLQAEVARDESVRQSSRLVLLLEAQLREGGLPAGPATELLTGLLDAALLYEDLAAIVRAQDALERTAAAAVPGAALAREVATQFSARLGEEARVRRLGEIIRHKQDLVPGHVARYLGVLQSDAVGTLLDVLDGLEPGPSRGPLIEALARLVPDRPQMLEARLGAANSQTVRDLVAIVVRGNFPDAARYLTAALRNPNAQVRIAVLNELSSAPRPEQAHRFLLEGTTDKTPAVRAAAFRAMAQLSPTRGAVDLLRLPKLPDWDKRDATERELIHVCMGLTQQSDVVTYFSRVLAEKKSLLNARKVAEAKLHAIAGLSAMGTLPAYKLLQGFTQQASEGKEDVEVLAASRKAMFEVKKRLFESAEGRSRPDSQAGLPAAEKSADAIFDEFQTAQREATAQAQQEKLDLEARMKARAASQSTEIILREAQRQAEAARPFGLDPSQINLPPPPPARPVTSSGPPRPPPREDSTRVVVGRADTSPRAPAPVSRAPTAPFAPVAPGPRIDTSPGTPRPALDVDEFVDIELDDGEHG
jgi:hypothetical protein